MSITKQDLLEAMSTTKQELLEAISTTKQDLLETISTTKQDLLEAMSTTKQDLLETIQILRDDFDEKFNKNDEKLEKMEQRIFDGIESVRVLVEAQKSDFRVAHEILQHHTLRLDDQEKRIEILEKMP